MSLERSTHVFDVEERSDVVLPAAASRDLEVGRTFPPRRGVAHVALLRRAAADVVLRVPVRLAGLVRARPETGLLDLARPLALEAGAVGVHAADRVHDVALVAVVGVPQGVRRDGAGNGGEGEEEHRVHDGGHHGEGGRGTSSFDESRGSWRRGRGKETEPDLHVSGYIYKLGTSMEPAARVPFDGIRN